MLPLAGSCRTWYPTRGCGRSTLPAPASSETEHVFAVAARQSGAAAGSLLSSLVSCAWAHAHTHPLTLPDLSIDPPRPHHWPEPPCCLTAKSSRRLTLRDTQAPGSLTSQPVCWRVWLDVCVITRSRTCVAAVAGTRAFRPAVLLQLLALRPPCRRNRQHLAWEKSYKWSLVRRQGWWSGSGRGSTRSLAHVTGVSCLLALSCACSSPDPPNHSPSPPLVPPLNTLQYIHGHLEVLFPYVPQLRGERRETNIAIGSW